MSLRDLLPWLPNYVKAFGPLAGAGAFGRVLRLDAANSREPVPLRLPGLAEPVWLRPAARDIAIVQQVWVKGEYDIRHAPHFPRLRAAYEAELAAGRQPLIIDCGAHIGMSVRWWRHLFPGARVFAVEPGSDNLAVLRRNVGGDSAVTVLEGGIWDRSGGLRLLDPTAGASALRVVETDGPGDLRAWTIPDIMALAGAARCLLVKVDIEGAEAALFRSNLGWLDQTSALAVELHDWLFPWQGTSRPLLRAMADHGFDCLLSGENLLCFRDEAAASPGAQPAQAADGD